MAINDQDIQALQNARQSKFSKKVGEDLNVKIPDVGTQKYKVVVDGVDDVTQAMAVAPYVDSKVDNKSNSRAGLSVIWAVFS